MRTILTTALACVFAQYLAAQAAISGTVRDENWEPLPFVAVQLLDAATKKTIKTATTDGYGQFVIDAPAVGEYFISANFAALGAVRSKKMAVCGQPVEMPDLQFCRNSAGAKRSAATELPGEKAAAAADFLAKN